MRVFMRWPRSRLFPSPIPFPPDNLRRAINRLLPVPFVSWLWMKREADFHPIRDASAKTYEYRIFRGEICSPFERRYVHHYPYLLDEIAFQESAALFEGEHDFTAFAASDKADALGLSKVRTIFSSTLECRSDHLIYRVRGSGFLKHMVRNIIGTLLEAGKGNIGTAEIEHLLSGSTDLKGGPTVPACGLFLISVEYL